MKKLYTIILLLCTAMLANAADYNLKVAGITVTDKTLNVLGDGSVVFYPSTNSSKAGILELHNANITATGNNYAIEYTGTAPLSIFNFGTSKITGATRLIHVPSANLEIVGANYNKNDNLTDKLILTGTNTGFGNVYCGGELLIRCIQLESKGGYSGLGGRANNELCQKIDIVGSKLDLSGDNGAVAFVKTMILERTDVTTEGATFDASKHTYVSGSTTVKNLAMAPTQYPVYVCGVQFNGYNCAFRGIQGVRYYPEINTITLEKLTVTSTGKDVPVINYKTSTPVKLSVIGKNTLKTTNSILAINSWAPLTITTTGNDPWLTLECESDHNNDYSAITVQHNSLSMENLTLVANTKYPVIGGLNSYSPDVTLTNCNITHNTSNRNIATIQGVGNMVTNNSSIYSKGSSINFTHKGKHSIDVKGASYISTDASCIKGIGENIDIAITGQGENNSKLTLTGLNLTGYNNIGISCDGNVNIKNVEFNISNTSFGICNGQNAYGKTLTLDAIRGTIETTRSAVFKMTAVSLLNGTAIVDPVGAVFQNGCYMYGGAEASKIKFNIVSDGIEGVESDQSPFLNSQKMYNLQGVEVGSSYRGIVIKNGKKYVVK